MATTIIDTMTDRVRRLRQRSLDAAPRISVERAELLTDFYAAEEGQHSVPVMRALAFKHLCEHKTIYIGEGELIVGERGPEPGAVPTFPELTCHSVEDLMILDSRPKTSYAIDADDIRRYAEKVIPFWRGRSIRDCAFALLSGEWKEAYAAGIFTEFMEQRAPGHTVADGKIYRYGLFDFKRRIADRLSSLDVVRDPGGRDQREQLRAMDIAADALILFAQRHADQARQMAREESDPERLAELIRIVANCERVPAHRPRDLWEALQAYWFYHLGVITELNGWDSFNPGHLDQHLEPFYRDGIKKGSLSRGTAKELLQCFWVKFNNHPAPPKVGVTAAESGTYTDFANINLGGLRRDGSDAVSDVSFLLLEVIDDMHILQPSNNIQLSRQNPEQFLHAALRVIRNGYGFPSMFNADAVVKELVRQGKSIEDAREGGTSGCVEAGAFGKEAYILTGYFNLPKVLEITLNNGFDPRTQKQLGPRTGDPRTFADFDELCDAFETQLQHFVRIKLEGNDIFERLYAEQAPAPFLSLIIDDCIDKGLDYNAGGARYNTSYVQGVGIGSLTDSLSAIKHLVFEGDTTMGDLLEAMTTDFEDNEVLRQRLLNKTPKYGNDDDRADDLMQIGFQTFLDAVEGRANLRGGEYHVDMLPTTCHIYFGTVTGAMPDGRHAGQPLSEGISPVQGADRQGPTAVLKSAAKMDQLETGGTLLNMKFSPAVLENESGVEKVGNLVRGYFAMDGHHIQLNVVTAETLREAQENPEQHRDLIVRVAGYSDYFCDISRELQDEIIARTEYSE